MCSYANENAEFKRLRLSDNGGGNVVEADESHAELYDYVQVEKRGRRG